jgi:hypothetical protein
MSVMLLFPFSWFISYFLINVIRNNKTPFADKINNYIKNVKTKGLIGSFSQLQELYVSMANRLYFAVAISIPAVIGLLIINFEYNFFNSFQIGQLTILIVFDFVFIVWILSETRESHKNSVKQEKIEEIVSEHFKK